VDALALEQHQPGYLGISADGSLPALVVDGIAMTDPGLALQYLAELEGQPRLAPTDASSWYDLQAWSELLDGRFALSENVQVVGWNTVMLTSLTAEELEDHRRKAAALPKKKESGWNAVWSDAEAGEDPVALASERIGAIVGRIEAALEKGPWILGADYSVADIQAFAHLHCLPGLLPDIVGPDITPRISDWLARIGERDAVRESLSATRRRERPASFPPPGA
jgi:glutathione S-transferase